MALLQADSSNDFNGLRPCPENSSAQIFPGTGKSVRYRSRFPEPEEIYGESASALMSLSPFPEPGT